MGKGESEDRGLEDERSHMKVRQRHGLLID